MWEIYQHLYVTNSQCIVFFQIPLRNISIFCHGTPGCAVVTSLNLISLRFIYVSGLLHALHRLLEQILLSIIKEPAGWSVSIAKKENIAFPTSS